jgi:hypothetical protein
MDAMDELSVWDWTAWRAASEKTHFDRLRAAAARVGGEVSKGLDKPWVNVRGCAMHLVPGGQVELGWDRIPVKLTAAERAHWSECADYAGSFEDFLALFLGPRHIVKLAPMLVERTPFPITDLEIDPYVENVEDGGARRYSHQRISFAHPRRLGERRTCRCDDRVPMGR